jgi:hypothetical protein
MPAVGLSHINPHFRITLADAFPPADASEVKALVADAALKLVYDKTVAARFAEQSRDNAVSQVSNQIRSHLVAPEYTQGNNTKGVGMTTATAGRKPLNANERITAADTAERVKFALQQWGREKSAPIVRVQQIAGVDRKTAASWYHGKSPPRAEHLFNLARHIPELKAEVRRLLGLEQDHHESFQREAIALLQRYAR